MAINNVIYSKSSTSPGDGWTFSAENPAGADLILLTVHSRSGSVSSITFGGVSAELIIASEDDWPECYIFGIKKENAPTTGESHTVDVDTSSSDGAVTITHIGGLLKLPDSLSQLHKAEYGNTSSVDVRQIDLVGSGGSIIFSALATRQGCETIEAETGEVLEKGCHAPPRGYGTSIRDAPDEKTYTILWTGLDSGRARLAVVELPISMGTASGQATDADGNPVDTVFLHIWDTKELRSLVEPDAEGHWSIEVPEGEYSISYFKAGYQPITHGPYTIEPES